jgi:hypothetical protein
MTVPTADADLPAVRIAVLSVKRHADRQVLVGSLRIIPHDFCITPRPTMRSRSDRPIASLAFSLSAMRSRAISAAVKIPMYQAVNSVRNGILSILAFWSTS